MSRKERKAKPKKKKTKVVLTSVSVQTDVQLRNSVPVERWIAVMGSYDIDMNFHEDNPPAAPAGSVGDGNDQVPLGMPDGHAGHRADPSEQADDPPATLARSSGEGEDKVPLDVPGEHVGHRAGPSENDTNYGTFNSVLEIDTLSKHGIDSEVDLGNETDSEVDFILPHGLTDSDSSDEENLEQLHKKYGSSAYDISRARRLSRESANPHHQRRLNQSDLLCPEVNRSSPSQASDAMGVHPNFTPADCAKSGIPGGGDLGQAPKSAMESDDEYDPTIFEDDVMIETATEQDSTALPLRTLTSCICQLLLMGCIANDQIPTDAPKCHPIGSHEGQVPVTDDGNLGHYKKITHKAPPLPKPSTEADDTPQLSEMTIFLVVSTFLVAGIIMPHLTMLECLSTCGSDRYLLAADKEGPSKSRVRRSAAALRGFLAGLIQLPRGITVDSGAADSVFPASWLRRSLLSASPGSIAKQFYVAASGTRLGNLGQFLLKFTTREGSEGGLVFQVASVNKPLASVSHLTDIGYCIVFNRHQGRDVSYLLHKDTNTFWKLRRDRGVFVMDAFLSESIGPRNDAEKIIDAGFARQGTP